MIGGNRRLVKRGSDASGAKGSRVLEDARGDHTSRMAHDRADVTSALRPSSGSAQPKAGAALRRARNHLRNSDPVLARLIGARPDFDPQAWMAELPPMDLFGALLFQVVGQQLSVAATRRTLGRLEGLFDGRLPSPSELLEAPRENLRQAGLSWRKVSTLGDLAAHFTDGRLDAHALSELPDDEIIAALTTIPGIGPWTVQGALILGLRRQDVVLPGDLALRKAIRRVYDIDHLPSQAEVLQIAENWRPYRSVATGYVFGAAFDGSRTPARTDTATERSSVEGGKHPPCVDGAKQSPSVDAAPGSN